MLHLLGLHVTSVQFTLQSFYNYDYNKKCSKATTVRRKGAPLAIKTEYSYTDNATVVEKTTKLAGPTS